MNNMTVKPSKFDQRGGGMGGFGPMGGMGGMGGMSHFYYLIFFLLFSILSLSFLPSLFFVLFCTVWFSLIRIGMGPMPGMMQMGGQKRF